MTTKQHFEQVKALRTMSLLHVEHHDAASTKSSLLATATAVRFVLEFFT
jgi:hypothetical protein